MPGTMHLDGPITVRSTLKSHVLQERFERTFVDGLTRFLSVVLARRREKEAKTAVGMSPLFDRQNDKNPSFFRFYRNFIRQGTRSVESLGLNPL